MRVRAKTLEVSVAISIPMSIFMVLMAPMAVKTAPNSTKPITLKAVKIHNIPANCWAVVNRKVFDLTAWISQHPGGSSRVIAMCGKDASRAFKAQHGEQPSPKSNPDKYEIDIARARR